MQRLINALCGTISRLLGHGAQEIVGVVGHPTPVVCDFLPARSFRMRRPSSPWAEMRVAYYAAAQSAAALLRQVRPSCRQESRTGWRTAPQKRTKPRTARG
jgi:hypothetical protein